MSVTFDKSVNNYADIDDDDDSHSSFHDIHEDDALFGNEHKRSYSRTQDIDEKVLSYQDAQLLCNELLDLFKKHDKHNSHTVSCEQFVSVVSTMWPVTNNKYGKYIKTRAIQLSMNDDDGLINYQTFLEENTFHPFLEDLGFNILRKIALNNRQVSALSDNGSIITNVGLFYRTLSIHNLHDKQIILSEAEQIQSLQNWIENEGKPAKLAVSEMRMQLERNETIIDTLNHKLSALESEMSEIHNENDQFEMSHSAYCDERASMLENMETMRKSILLNLSPVQTDDENETMEEKVDKLKLDNQLLIQKNVNLESQNKQYMARNQQYMDQNQTLRKQCEQNEKNVNMLNVLMKENDELNHCQIVQNDSMHNLKAQINDHRQELLFLRTSGGSGGGSGSDANKPTPKMERIRTLENGEEFGFNEMDIGNEYLLYGSRQSVDMLYDVGGDNGTHLYDNSMSMSVVTNNNNGSKHLPLTSAYSEYEQELMALRDEVVEEKRQKELLQKQISQILYVQEYENEGAVKDEETRALLQYQKQRTSEEQQSSWSLFSCFKFDMK